MTYTCGETVDSDNHPLSQNWICEREVAEENQKCIWHRHSPKKNPDEVQRELEKNDEPLFNANFSEMHINGAIFHGEEMHNSDFYNATIRNCEFRSVNLTDVNFEKTKLDEVLFVDCNLDRVSLNEAELSDVEFQNCDGESIQIRKANFLNSGFSDCTLSDPSIYSTDCIGTSVEDTEIYDGSINLVEFRRCAFSEVLFRDLTIKELEVMSGSIHPIEIIDLSEDSTISFENLDQIDIDLSGRDMEKCEFSGCTDANISIDMKNISQLIVNEVEGRSVTWDTIQINRALFNTIECDHLHWNLGEIQEGNVKHVVARETAELQHTDFDLETIRNVNFRGGKIDGCKFIQTESSEVDIRNGDIIDTIYEGGSLSKSAMAGVTIEDSEFQSTSINNSDVSGMDKYGEVAFTQSDMSGSDFSDSDLSNANLKYINFEECDLNGTNLRNSDLRGARLFDSKFNTAKMNEDTDWGYYCYYEYVADKMAKENADNSPDIGNLDEDDLAAETDPIRRFLPNPITSSKSFKNRLINNEGWRNNNASELKSAARVYRAYQQLFRNNQFPDKIRRFRVREKEAHRKRALVTRDWIKWLRLSILRWGIQYGESYRNVLVHSALVIFAWTLIYMHRGDLRGATISEEVDFLTALYFSITTFATLGYGDLEPVSDLTRMLAGIQSLIGTALIAVLIFILVRRATW